MNILHFLQKKKKAAVSEMEMAAFVFDQCLLCKNADALLVVAVTVKLYNTVDQSVKGIIGADTNTCTGMHVCASLSDNDVACNDGLTVGLLNTESLCVGITAVLGRTDTFLMSKEL